MTVSESDYKTKNATFSYAGLPDGDYTVVSVSATDLVGNTGTKTLNAPLKIDSTLPVIAFSFNGADAEGKLVKGLENLRISVTDASGDASLISLQLAGGPNSEKVTLAFTPLSKDVFIPEYPRIFPNTDESGQMYHLEALAIDESGNRTTKTLNFTYQPANLIMLDNLKTLATAVALKATDKHAAGHHPNQCVASSGRFYHYRTVKRNPDCSEKRPVRRYGCRSYGPAW